MHEPKEWEETMTQEEVNFCYKSIFDVIDKNEGISCVDNHRAARIWVSSQRRRYKKQKDRGCCGFYDAVVQRWNPEKNRFDLYMIGFNYGH